VAVIDRWLPRRPSLFLLAVTLLVAGCWGLGLALAADARTFLASNEWRAQPAYLAAHLITLRLFATAFVRSFRAGISHLRIGEAAACHRMWLVLGPVGGGIAVAIAAPFAAFDYSVLADPAVHSSIGRGADALLYAMWCAEWLLMAFIWVMVGGYMLVIHWAVSRHSFRAMIEVVLHERQYRPFLHMSVQGATLVLGFWIVNVAYVWYSGGALSDYAGAVITLVLVVIGFLPPLVELRAKVARAVNTEMASLRRHLERLITHDGAAAAVTAGGGVRALEERLEEALILLRISYLEKLYTELGQSEAIEIVIKLVVPATTVAWYGYKYYKGWP
jgi:hypothetical protein